MDKLIQELKNEGVLTSPRIERALRAVDRADFVPQDHIEEAYGNYPLPIGQGQTISQPLTVVFMLELLNPQPEDTVLEVGAGSGWQTALLAHMVGNKGRVIAIERIPALVSMARRNVEKYPFKNITIIDGDGTKGYVPHALYDAIIAGAAGKEVPPAWKQQLKINGSIVAPFGRSIYKVTKKPDSTFSKEEYPGFIFVPLRKDDT